MLVLSRSLNESIVFYFNGEKVGEVTVTAILDHKVKLGFTGPKSMVVARSELSTQAIEKLSESLQLKNEEVK